MIVTLSYYFLYHLLISSLADHRASTNLLYSDLFLVLLLYNEVGGGYFSGVNLILLIFRVQGQFHHRLSERTSRHVCWRRKTGKEMRYPKRKRLQGMSAIKLEIETA